MRYKNKDNKGCKGCLILNTCEREPSYERLNGEGIDHCPCKLCMIKMMCKMPCSEFKKYTFSLYKLNLTKPACDRAVHPYVITPLCSRSKNKSQNTTI